MCCFIAIPCLIYLLIQKQQFSFVISESRYWYLLPALGLVSAIGLSANLKSNQQIPVSVFRRAQLSRADIALLIAIFWLNTQVSFPITLLMYRFGPV